MFDEHICEGQAWTFIEAFFLHYDLEPLDHYNSNWL